MLSLCGPIADPSLSAKRRFSLTCSHWNKLIGTEIDEADDVFPAAPAGGMPLPARTYSLLRPQLPSLSSSFLQAESLNSQIERLRQSNDELLLSLAQTSVPLVSPTALNSSDPTALTTPAASISVQAVRNRHSIPI